MALTRFAWLIHCNDEGAANGKWQASINWVMPWGTFGTKTWPQVDDPLTDPDAASARSGDLIAEQLGDMLWPWKLALSDWYGVEEAAGAHKLVALTTDMVSAPTDVLGLQGKIENEIRAKTVDCVNPFSLEARYLADQAPNGGSSLPHALAPLTHLPSAVAQDILGMCRVLRCNAAAQATCRAIAPAFSAGTKAGTFSFTPVSALLDKGIFTIAYDIKDASGEPALPDFVFEVITQALVPALADKEENEAKCVLGGAEMTDFGVRETLVAKAFSPLAVLSSSLGKIPDDAPGLPPGTTLAPPEAILLKALGQGVIRRDTVQRAGFSPSVRHVAVWEYLDRGNEQRTVEILDWLGKANPGDSLVLEMGRNIKKAYDLPQQSRAALAPLADALDPVFDANDNVDVTFLSKRGRAIISAASLLLGSEDARQLWAAWLATLAAQFGATAANGILFWAQGGDFSAWHRRLLAILDDQTAAALLADEPQRALGAPLIADPASLTEGEVTNYAAQFAAQVAGMLSAPPVPELVAVLEVEAVKRVSDLRLGLTGNYGGDTSEPLFGDDRDLAVTLKLAEDQTGVASQRLRGYAVAMAAGYVDAQSRLGWQWLTNVAAQARDGKKWVPLESGGKPVPMFDTVGATKVNGRDVISFVYSGLPLNGRLNSVDAGEVDPDGVDALDFYWPEVPVEWPTPRLAYGLTYWAIATPIGNAGRIMDPNFVRGSDRVLPELDNALFKDAGSIRYLCRVAPGSPVFSLAEERGNPACELADESRTRTYLNGLPAQRGMTDQQRIALIRPKDGPWIRGQDALSFVIRGPDGTPNVVERWLQADLAQRIDGAAHAEDPAVTGMDAAAITKLQEQYRNLLKPSSAAKKPKQSLPQANAADELKRRQNWPRHPAVRAFGITVELFSADGAASGVPEHRFVQPDCEAWTGYISHASINVKAGTKSEVGKVAGNTLTVTLAPGCFARLEVCSLAPEMFFTGKSGLLRMSDAAGKGTWTGQGVAYRSFAPSTHWVECLPQPALPAAREDLLNALAERLSVSVDVNKVVAEIAGPDAIDASWVSGFLVQRHEWHWTGYPVAFPRPREDRPSLLNWAEPFIGTESLRESLVDTVQARLSTSDGWHFGGAGQVERLASTLLPSDRGAKYIAFVVRPVRRFDRWLERWHDFDNAILGSGLLLEAKLRWDDPGLRLPPPDLKAAVPLVHTFAETARSDRGSVVSTGNGCMLIMRDVLYRTDELARYGGVSEFIDVDLEETRISEVFEIGPNPVFHAGLSENNGALTLPYASVFAKSGESAASDAVPKRRMNWRLVAGRPFGLSNDLDRNAKVAQTAIIVRPEGTDVANYWVMAKVKLRRVYDPDPNWTTPAWVPSDPVQPDSWNLGRRAEGEEWIPHDFCVELPEGALTSMRLVPGPQLLAATPVGLSLRTRYLCTWHKGQWADKDESLWGLQVLIQQLLEDNGQWKVTARFSPYETHDKDGPRLDTRNPAPALLLLAAGKTPGKHAVTRLLVSDYSEPHWLTFIGMPYRTAELANEAYWLTEKKGGLTLMRSNRASGNVEVRTSGEPVSRDLLVLPVNPADFGLDGKGKTREEVENNSFHLLLVFKRVDDVTTPGAGMPLGQLVGVYKPKRKPITEKDPYPPMTFEPFMAAPVEFPDHADCTAFLYRFHTPHDSDVGNIENWEDVQMRMFPTKNEFGEGAEATVRWTPEYIGPLSVTDEGKWPAHIPRPAAVTGKRIEIRMMSPNKGPNKKKDTVELIVDPSLGWRVKAKFDADQLVPDDIVSGTCELSDGLELRLAGGRLLATLEGWHPGQVRGQQPGTGPLPARLFDSDGKRLPQQFTWTPLP